MLQLKILNIYLKEKWILMFCKIQSHHLVWLALLSVCNKFVVLNLWCTTCASQIAGWSKLALQMKRPLRSSDKCGFNLTKHESFIFYDKLSTTIGSI